MSKKVWCVQAKDLVWCEAKDQSSTPDPSGVVATRCDQFVTLPWGVAQTQPTCPKCLAPRQPSL